MQTGRKQFQTTYRENAKNVVPTQMLSRMENRGQSHIDSGWETEEPLWTCGDVLQTQTRKSHRLQQLHSGTFTAHQCNTCSHKTLCIDVLSSFTHDSQTGRSQEGTGYKNRDTPAP